MEIIELPGYTEQEKLDIASERLSRVQQPESDVVKRGDRLLEVEPLEHESQRVRPQSGQLPIRRLRNVVANDVHTAARRPLERAHDRQQSRLARPRRPHHRQLLSLTPPRS